MSNLSVSSRHVMPIFGSVLWVGLGAFALHQLLHALVVIWHGDAAYFLCQFDCNWYAEIVRDGYMPEANGDAGGSHSRRDVANWAFFPLFPLLSKIVALITGLSPVLAVMVTAKGLWLVAIWAFLFCQRQYVPSSPLWLGAALLTLNPAAIYANTGYTEPLFVLLTCLSLSAIRQGRPVLAGIFGALLSATRAVGLGVGLAFLVYAMCQVWRRDDADVGKLLFSGLLMPLGLAAYMIFLYLYVGDAMAFSNIQRAWDRELGNPLGHLMADLDKPGYPRYMALVAILGITSSVYLVIRDEWGLGLFLTFATLIPLSTGTTAMGRYVFIQPAFLLALLLFMQGRVWLRGLVGMFALGYLGMSYTWQEALFFVI